MEDASRELGRGAPGSPSARRASCGGFYLVPPTRATYRSRFLPNAEIVSRRDSAGACEPHVGLAASNKTNSEHTCSTNKLPNKMQQTKTKTRSGLASAGRSTRWTGLGGASGPRPRLASMPLAGFAPPLAHSKSNSKDDTTTTTTTNDNNNHNHNHNSNNRIINKHDN